MKRALYSFQKEYVVLHTWCFSNGFEGRYERRFYSLSEAREYFDYLRLLIENDEYNFDVHFSLFEDGDITFSAYEKVNSLVNRQDLVLFLVEV